jgi:hypothetical protein
MDLEQFKAAWQREKQQYQAEMSSEERAARIGRIAEERERKYRRDLQKQLTLGSLCLILLATQYDRHLPLVSNLGLGVMVLCGAIALGFHYVMKRRLREASRGLPREEYLAEQKEIILARIKILWGNLTWLLGPAFAGFLVWVIAGTNSKATILVFISLAIITGVITIWCIRRMIRKDLLPMIEDIDQELADLERKPVSRSD